MTYSIINSAIGTGGSDGCSILGLDMTGVDLLVLLTAQVYDTPVTVSDSQTNSYTSETKHSYPSLVAVQTHYKQAPSVSASMDFTVAGSASASNIAVLAFSGSVASPRDDISSNDNSPTPGTSLSPGNVLLAENNELIVVAAAFGDANTRPTVDLSFVSPVPLFEEFISSPQRTGLAVSYKLVNFAGLVNPTFSWPESVRATIQSTCWKSAVTTIKVGSMLVMYQ